MELLFENFINNTIKIINNPIYDEENLEINFTKLIKENFNIDEVIFNNIYKEEDNDQEYSYIINSKQIFIDNELSEYSIFPKSIEYKNRGYKSCAVSPIFVYAKPILIVELLSYQKNKFEEETLNVINFTLYLLSLNLLYKQTIKKMNRLSDYFNTAFNLTIPQIIVKSDNSIIKLNKDAANEFGIEKGEDEINNILNYNFNELNNLKNSKIIINRNIYKINSNKLSDNLIYLALNKITDSEVLDKIIEAVQTSQDVFLMFLDNDFTIKEITQNFDKLSGKLIIEKKFTSLMDVSQKNEFLQKVSELNENKKNVSSSLDLIINEKPFYIKFVMTKYFKGYIIILINTTAERYIKNIRQDFDEFIKNTSDIVIITDELGFIKDANMCIGSVLNYNPKDLIGTDIKKLYKDDAILDRDMTYARNNGKVDNSYITLIKKNKEEITAIHFLRMLKFIDNSINYIILIKELETKRLIDEQENELRNQKNQIRRTTSTSELKSQFIYNISHELKTPLTNIIGFSKLLYTNEFGELNREQKEYIKTILDETDRLMLIIQQVLDASKLDANKIKLDIKEIDLNSFYNISTIKALEDAITNKKLYFEWKVEPDVPKINADPNRLMQVFVNLIGNALKFTDEGSIKVHIFKKNKNKIECDIIDTGIGINEEDKHKIFKKFYQATKKELVKQDGAGTGLGLAITRDIISMHKGKISFESNGEKGTIFWFTLPIKQK